MIQTFDVRSFNDTEPVILVQAKQDDLHTSVLLRGDLPSLTEVRKHRSLTRGWLDILQVTDERGHVLCAAYKYRP